MKKEDIAGTIVYLIIIAFAFIFVFTILQEHAGSSELGQMYFLFNIGAFIAGVIFNAILFEVAHIIGALAGGYQIISVNILGFCFFKDANKRKFAFKNFDGLTGETKICPKENNDGKEPNPYPYLFFGSLFFVIEVVAVMVVFSIYRNNVNASLSNLAYFLLTVGFVGLALFIYNIMPLKLDSQNDGYKLTMVANPKNRKAFNELLTVEYEISQGKNVSVKTFDEITNFTADLNLNQVYILLDNKKFKEADELLDKILDAKNNISNKVYIRAKAQKIYIHLIYDEPESLQNFYDTQVPVNERRAISEDISMVSIRAYLLMSGLLDKSRSECVIALNNVNKAFKYTPENRKEIEAKLFNESLDKVVKAHPKWELDSYFLKYEPKVNNK